MRGEGSAAKKRAEQNRALQGTAGLSRAEEGRAVKSKARHGRARAGLVTADGKVLFCDTLHASGILESIVGTHEAFSLPGSLFAIEPVGANVALALVGVAAQHHESHMPHTRVRRSRI
jgi:hypothetical protein